MPLVPRALIVLALVAAMATLAQARRAGEPYRIALVNDGPSPRVTPLTTLLNAELTALMENDAPTELVEFRGDWTAAGAAKAATAAFADKTIDLVLAVGTLGSQELGRRSTLPKPAIAGVIIDPAIQGVPFARGTSGKANLSYLSWSWSPTRDLATFKDLVDFKRVVMLVHDEIIAAAPELQAKVTADVAEIAPGFEMIGVGADAAAALAAIPADVDAIYLGPLLHLSPEAFQALVGQLNMRRLPTFSLVGRAEVDQGVLACTARATDVRRFARRIALNVQRVLVFGEAAKDLPVAYTRGQRLTINMATARAIGFSPSWRHLTEAELIHSERPDSDIERFDLPRAVEHALAHNLDLKTATWEVRAGAQEIRKARSSLLPSLSIRLAGQMIDDDRAAASFGNSPERTLALQGEVSQVIYSDAAWANLSVQEALQASRDNSRDAVVLDVIRDAAVAYLNVVRAKTIERITRENVNRTRENLELAETRHRLGAGTMADVHRFESEIASDRGEVINANAQRNVAEIELNRLLHRPAEASFATGDVTLTEANAILDQRVVAALDNPASFKVFREFMAERALETAPELGQLDHAIAAQERLVAARERVYWLPEVGASFALTQLLAKGGTGTESGLPITVPGVELPTTDNTIWTASVFLRLPLFEGTRRYAEAEQARLELSRLKAQRAAIAQRIEQRLRSSIHVIGARGAAIGLSRDAAEAAHKNLAIVTEAYSRGVVPIPTLLDAQNAAFIADSVAANAVADYLIAAMDSFRAIGIYPFRLSEGAKKDFIERLQARLDAAEQARQDR